jgi:hypothetical protein
MQSTDLQQEEHSNSPIIAITFPDHSPLSLSQCSSSTAGLSRAFFCRLKLLVTL